MKNLIKTIINVLFESKWGLHGPIIKLLSKAINKVTFSSISDRFLSLQYISKLFAQLLYRLTLPGTSLAYSCYQQW